MSSTIVTTLPEGLLTLVAPVMRQVRCRLRNELAHSFGSNEPLPIDADTLEVLLYPQLANQMFMLVAKAAVLEMHVARLQDELAGETPQERFEQFVARLTEGETATAIFQEYPVLRRQTEICAEQWFNSSLELGQRLAADWPLICEMLFYGAEPGDLVAVEGGAGDRHCGGRSVQILHFASGERVVYKPKSLAVEARFGDLLHWLNSCDAAPRLRPLHILNCGTHGWVEFVPSAPCQSEAEVERFYQRQGAYLALLHLLAATDFHFENIVAAGEHPVLIDLEALFHHRLPGSMNDPSSRELIDSVMAVRLLPQVSRIDGCDDAIDFSGLGATAGRATPFRAATFAAAGTDDMRLMHETYRLHGGQHRPRLRDAEVELAAYETAVTDGFTAMYNLLLARRDGLLRENSLFAAFAGAEVRFIARPTQVYAILLEQSTHPDRLRMQAARGELFDRLSVRADALPCLNRLLKAELADMDEHNIPIFTTRPDSRDLWSSRGECIENFFDRSGLDLVHDRLRGFGPADLARQSAFIGRSFASLA